jgi:hypothetical protein
MQQEIIEEIQDAITQSINDYAARIQGMGVREILNSDYRPPSKNFGDLNMNDPTTLNYVNSWEDAMSEWRQRYGSMKGWNEFNDWWAVASTGLISMTAAFFSSRYQSIRDRFGYASKDYLYRTRASDIARNGPTAQ